MPSLRELQHQFADALLSGDDAAVTDHWDGGHDGVAQRFQVYRNNVAITQRDALTAIFPVVQRLIGEDCFRDAANVYLQRQGSTSGDLNALGEFFPFFLDFYTPTATLPYLHDVALLEWHYHHAYHAANAAPFPLQRLGTVHAEDYANLQFVLHPSVRIMASNYPIVRIWQVNQHGVESATVSLDDSGGRLLIARPQWDVEFIPLEAGAYQWLLAVSEGAYFEAALTQAHAAQPDFDIQPFFAFCIAHGLIVEFINSHEASL